MGSRRIFEKTVYRRYAETEVVDLVDGKKIKRRIRKSSGPGSVTIIPIVGINKVLLVRQYRPALRKPGNGRNNGWIYELPGGHTEDDETVQEAARRELEEEIGYTAKEIKLLYNRHFTPWSSDALDNMFVAKGLKKGMKKPDNDEFITTAVFRALRQNQTANTSGLKRCGARYCK